MKKLLYNITLSILITTLISGCGRKAAPKYVEGGFFPQTYPAPDKIQKNNATDKKTSSTEKNLKTDANKEKETKQEKIPTANEKE